MSTNEPPPEQPVPPPAGGYGEAAPPPPPTGGYGDVPPPPPPPAPPGGSGYNIGDALAYGWKKFQENVGQIILAAIVLFVVYVVAGAIAFGIIALLTSDPSCDVSNGTLVCDEGSGWFWRTIVYAIAIGFLYVVLQIVGAGIVRGALGITEGRPFQTAELFKTEQLGSVVVASLLVGIATSIGYALCYLPGIAIAFLTSYTLFFVIDKNLSPVDAIRASIDLTTKNLGNTVLWYVVGGLVAVAGIIACVVGLVVTVPLAIIGGAYTYKFLTNEPVAP